MEPATMSLSILVLAGLAILATVVLIGVVVIIVAASSRGRDERR